MLDIIVPVYQAYQYLEKAVRSLLTNPEAHIILIDNGSTDGSGELADALAKEHGRITVFHQENKGVSAARNKGLELSKAEYIAFMDSDDFAADGYYSHLLAAMLEKNADLAFGKFRHLYEDGSEHEISEAGFDALEGSFKDFGLFFSDYENSNVNRKNALMGVVWRCIFKREIIEKNALRFNEKIYLSEDLFFLLNYINCCASCCTVNDSGYTYRIRSASASAASYKEGFFEMRLECIKELKKVLADNGYMDNEEKETILNRSRYTCAYETISNEMRFNPNGTARLKEYLAAGLREELLTDGAIKQAQAENASKKIPAVLKLCRAGRINIIRLLYSL